METADKIRKSENLHIVFWLVKDTCWMLEIKWLGTLMIIPTIAIAIYIILRTKNTSDYFISWAILCWISANSFWMLMEFFNQNTYKNFAAIPFFFGFFFAALYYLKLRSKPNL